MNTHCRQKLWYEILLKELCILKIKTLNTDAPPIYGICNWLSYYNDLTFQKIYKQWPNWSGVNGYPVPSTTSISPEHMFHQSLKYNKLWDKTTEYGKLRYDLLDYCIEFCSNQLGMY